MQTQDAPAEIIFKFWPWLEANRKLLIGIGVATLVGFFAWFFLDTQRLQAEIAAGQAYTQFQMSQPPNTTAKQVADGYGRLADKYAGTMAGQRARLQAAAVLFSAGSYPEAQAQFQNFLAGNGSSPLAVYARLGLASCLEAQGKLDDALRTYQTVANAGLDSSEAVMARFAQGRLLEMQGKLIEAASAYESVARSPLGGSLGNEAGQRLGAIQAQAAAAKPAAAPAK